MQEQHNTQNRRNAKVIEDDLWLIKDGDDLEIRSSRTFGINTDIVDIEDHFDPSGGFNTRYLFVVDDDMTAANNNFIALLKAA